jgi:threonine dehydrogenase-like Zn-dependent dehydrogenase
MFGKGLSLKAGVVQPLNIAPALKKLIEDGKASPGFVFGKEIPIDEAPETYRKFSKHEILEVIIRFK